MKIDAMNDLDEQCAILLPPQLRAYPWRMHPLDGKLLLFERNSGLNVLLEGEETAHLRRRAPRTLMIAVTNYCNLACSFCYRDKQTSSLWHYETLLEFCRQADQWGVLEVAFGGGEPLVFPRWQDFVCEIYETTRLGINFTTNGTLLTESFLQAIAGHYGQIRLSIYEDNNWAEKISLLTQCQARFGINWLITPRELLTLEAKFEQLFELGVRDFMLLSYKGCEPDLHLSERDRQRLELFILQAYEKLKSHITLKLDVCWGDTLAAVPRLFSASDCGAGDDFISLTSDKRIKPCSFQPWAIPFESCSDVRAHWESQRSAREAALIAGCARLPNRGLNVEKEADHAYIHLARI